MAHALLDITTLSRLPWNLITVKGYVAIIISFFFVGLALRGTYNRYFHPLAKFPGPFWGSVSDFYKLYVIIMKDAHTRGVEMHKRYGPIVRVAPNLLAFNDPYLLPTVYHRRVDKTDFYSTSILGELAPPFQTLKHEEHAAKRKRIAPSFSMTNLKRFEGEVDKQIDEMLTIFKNKFAQTGKPLDFACWAQWFVYDLVSHLSFGSAIGFVKEGKDIGGLIEAFHSMAPLAGLVAAIPWVVNPILKNPLLKRWLMPKAGDNTGTGRIMKYRDEMLEHRLKNRHAVGHGDFLEKQVSPPPGKLSSNSWDSLLHAQNADGSLISIEEVKVECFILMVAASDTTSAFICPFVNNIIQDQRIYNKLQAEIDEFERQGRLTSPVVKFDETNQMPYYMACVKENLRFSPSTPMIMPRYISDGGIIVDGTLIPERAEMGANPYVIHRDISVYGEDAHLFRPERWLVDHERVKEMDRYLMTFGYGTRSCLGKNIAQLETQKLCLQLFRNFNIGPVNARKPWRHENLAISIYWDQWLNITERQKSQVA